MENSVTRSNGKYRLLCQCGCGEYFLSNRPDKKYANTTHKNRSNRTKKANEYAEEIAFCNGYMFNAKVIREYLQNHGGQASHEVLLARKINFETMPCAKRNEEKQAYFKFGRYRLTIVGGGLFKISKDE